MRRLALIAALLAGCGGTEPTTEIAEAPTSEPEPEPDPTPTTVPDPTPAPTPDPDPTPAPAPTPDPTPASDGCPSELPDGMACVPGGTFTRGDAEGPDNERPAAPITISTFLLDTHEVDNARYRECVEAGVCQRLMPFRGYMGTRQPAVGMRWQDADAYCRWRGKRLPTEAEFERAARGPDETRYPWGDEIPDEPCSMAIVRIAEGRGCGTGVTWDVGSRPVGPYGLYDMSGNVWEWVADHYSWCYRGCGRECGDDCFVDDPQGRCGDPHAECPESLGHRTVRGGSWWYTIDRATTTARRGVPGENPNPHRFGFRCALDVADPS